MKEVSLNFGAIRDTAFRVSSKQLVRENTGISVVMNNFLNEIKNNHILKIQYLIYKNIENGSFDKERLAERYINQNIKLAESLKWKDVIDANKKLRKDTLGEYHVEGNINKSELYENIHTLIEANSKAGYSDIDKSEKAYEFILSHLLKKNENTESNIVVNESEEMPSFFSWRFITERAVSNFNERYSHLNETERSLLKVLTSPIEDKINFVENIKSENLTLISNILKESDINEETVETLKNFEAKIKFSDGVVNEQNVDEYIINFAELNELLKEEK